MLKIISIICCFIISAYYHGQTRATIDSSKSSIIGHFTSTKNTKPDLSIYPNPAKNKVTLQVKEFEPGMAAVKLMDIRGKIIKEDNRLLTNGSEDIIMFLMEKAGIYFIQVSQQGKVVRKKLVVL